MKFRYTTRDHRILVLLAISAMVYSGYYAIKYAWQLPVDAFSFRQTQTALTAYWFVKEGYQLAYQTPVGGAPWSIPFEFPIYQYIVALVNQVTGIDINAVGRLVSYFFLVATLYPVLGIIYVLKLPTRTFLVFLTVYLTMPLHIYWGRSFMIETTALFFGVMTIRFFLVYLLDARSFLNILGFIISAALCVLQKSTTGVPILIVLSIAFFLYETKKNNFRVSLDYIRSMFLAAAMVLIPIAVGACWMVYSDIIKSQNEFGGSLTATALSAWNWGAIEQRFSLKLWYKIFVDRLLIQNLGGVIGLVLLALPFVSKKFLADRLTVVYCLSFALMPFILFPNLHIIHEYYQVANGVFLAFAISVVLARLFYISPTSTFPLVALSIVVASNAVFFKLRDAPNMKISGQTDNRDVAIGYIIKTSVPVGGQFVAFGNDWSSSFAYFSERKSFTVPEWFKDYEKVIAQPERYVEPERLGAVISCQTPRDISQQIQDWAQSKDNWKLGVHSECLIATPELVFNFKDDTQVGCEASELEFNTHMIGGNAYTHISGWLIPKINITKQSESVFIRAQKTGSEAIYINAMQAPRAEVNRKFGVSDATMVGFTRLLGNELSPGEYSFDIVYASGGAAFSCSSPSAFTLN